MKDVVAVTGGIAPEAAGGLVWWRLSGAMRVEAVRTAWEDAGLDPDEAPKPPSPQVALARALRAQAGPRRLVRPLEGGDQLVVDEAPLGGGLTWQPIAQLRLGEQGPTAITLRGQAGLEVYDAVQDAFDKALHEVATEDLSPYLARKVMAFDAVALRDTGGFYFIPRARMAGWQAVVGALRRCSREHMIASVPALAGDEAALAVLDAIHVEVSRLCESIYTEIEEAVLGPRGLRTRAERAQAAAEKLAAYRQLLGERVDGLAERVDTLKASITAAVLVADKREMADAAAARD